MSTKYTDTDADPLNNQNNINEKKKISHIVIIFQQHFILHIYLQYSKITSLTHAFLLNICFVSCFTILLLTKINKYLAKLTMLIF